jgi:DNA-binding transcriptional LysR family regulator
VRLPAVVPDLSTLDLFLSVAECGSLGEAGKRHGITQPAVSMRMTQLEREIGMQLLDRTRSGTRLTPAGTAVVGWARRVVDLGAAMMTAVAAMRLDTLQPLSVWRPCSS